MNTSRYAVSRSSPKPGARGFTLIELLIVVLIVAAMAAFANATYTQYITKSRRAAAAAFLLGVANRQEQYFLDARQYAADMTTLGISAPPEVSDSYTIATSADNTATPPTYQVTATPVSGSAQEARDTKCAVLTLTSAGVKSVSGSGSLSDCWQ